MATRIKHVYGNVFRLGIPLTKRIIDFTDGIKTTDDLPFEPLMSGAPIKVVFAKKFVNYERSASMVDGFVVVEDKGALPVGAYSVTVLATDYNGDPLRFKEDFVLQIVDTTAEADYDQIDGYDGWFKFPILTTKSSGGKGSIWQRDLVWERSSSWYSRNN